MNVSNACMYLLLSSSFGSGQDPPLHTIVFIMETFCLENITFEDYVVGYLLFFFTGTHKVVS